VDGTLVVNVGVVGRPANDGLQETWYAVLDLEDGKARAQLVPVAYDWRAQAASMRSAGLPDAFVETIETGWWTTCLEVVPPRERSRGRFHVYREALANTWRSEEVGWAHEPELPDDGRPVVELFGTAAFPSRLWVYTNFHCNLACEYCVVASSPRARRRSLGLARFRELVDEAVREGFRELYLTGGEPFLEPDIVAMLDYARERLDTVVLTNAMLFTGWRRRELARLAERERLVVQTSLDGASADTHDAWRGAGSFARALDGIAYAQELGLPLRVAMTETPENRDQVEDLRELLAGLGIVGEDFAVRPLVRRGFAAQEASAVEVDDAILAPELTVTADGVHWHPIGGDIDASPDLLVARGQVPLSRAKQLVVERFLSLRQEPLLGAGGCARLQAELIRHTATWVAGFTPAAWLAFTPADARTEIAALTPPSIDLFAQRGDDLGRRLRHATELVFGHHQDALAVIGADAPELGPVHVRFAEHALRARHHASLIPTVDGGYALIALARAVPVAFDLPPAAWGGPDVLSLTLTALQDAGCPFVVLEPVRDLDTPEDAKYVAADPRCPPAIKDILKTPRAA
jgi:glycosyltransferase A (GT-A) superfamily protein (DUF2064 family)/pyruvate-formate lyase-activating enzyme